jgi:hypothetical protein
VLGLVTGSGALAVNAQDRPGLFSGVATAETYTRFIRADDLDDAPIYTLSRDYDMNLWDTTPYYDAVDPNWENIGEVDDLVLSRNGQLIGIVAEVGGWLDIGDSHVILNFDDVRVIGGPAGLGTGYGEIAFVTRLSEEQIEAMDEIDEGWWD